MTIAFWIPRKYGAKLGYLVTQVADAFQVIDADVSRADAIDKHASYTVIADTDGRRRFATTISRYEGTTL